MENKEIKYVASFRILAGVLNTKEAAEKFCELLEAQHQIDYPNSVITYHIDPIETPEVFTEEVKTNGID